jgi:hypothetical protein
MEDTATLISLASALIAILSAIYASRQAKAAALANRIALHADRLDVLNGLSRFRVHVVARGASITEDEVWKFAEVVERSELYFPESVYRGMNSLQEKALRLMSLNEQWHEAQAQEPERAPSLAKPKQEFMREVRDECQKLTDELKKHLRVGESAA